MRGNDVLDAPLLSITKREKFTLRDAVQGVLVTGGIGSGKTSGSGAALAGAYLKAGMGGLVLCAKHEEVELWRHYCAKHGRSGSLIVLDGSTAILNFLLYELMRQGGQGLNAVVELLMRLLEIARAASPAPGRPGEAFWDDTMRQIFRNTLPALYAATGTIRIADLLAMVRGAPSSPEQMHDVEWQRQSPFFAILCAAADRLDDATGERLMAYWRGDFARLDQKTRGNIVISLTTALDRFNHGWLRNAFATDSSVPPELSFHGAIIVLAMPALTMNEDGIIAQQLYKYMWQRSVLARNSLDPAQQQRPVFLWADEAQYFVNSYDAEFLSTCRGSRACVVFLTQSLPTFYAKMGENSRDRVHHLLGNFATKIWHNNSCPETNDWAARTIGRGLQRRATYSEGEGSNQSFGMNMGENTGWNRNTNGTSFFGSVGGFGAGDPFNWDRAGSESGGDAWGRNRGHGRSTNTSRSTSEQMDFIIDAGQFGRMLKTGGPANGNRVSAVWYQAGRQFVASGGNSLLAEFAQ